MNITVADLWAQYQRAVGAFPWVPEVEREYGLPPFLLFAVGSRETGWRMGYARGEVHDDGHGWGLFGADDRWNRLDLPAFASDPLAQATLAAATLRTNYRLVSDWLTAVNAYGPAAGRPAYGHDVLERAAYLSRRTGGTMPRRIYTRTEWGARAPRSRSAAPGMTHGIGVHYLGDGEGPTGGLEASMAAMRWVQDFHMGPERGWSDFAYNDACDMFGNLFEGRGPKIRNAANGGGVFRGLDSNAGWHSVLYLNGTGGPGLTDDARDAINDLAEQRGVAGGDWLGHRDFLSTGCPGDETYGWIHGGHPRGSAAPTPEPTPTLDLEDTMHIYDGPPEIGGGVYVSDGDRIWGVSSESWLRSFFFTGFFTHGGTIERQAFFEMRDREGNPRNPGVGLAAFEEEGLIDVGGVICRSVAEVAAASPNIETGDPGCATILS